jgi:hypothetical protein
MLAAEWHLIDESYGWPAAGLLVVCMTQFAKNSDESRRLRRNLTDCREHLPLVPATHE